jgi:hypothetical protein
MGNQYTQPRHDDDEKYEQHQNVHGRDESIATVNWRKTDDFPEFKLPLPSESTTESESDDSSAVFLEGGDY